MTIKEAVEKYEYIHSRIRKIRATIRAIVASRDVLDPLGTDYYKISQYEMEMLVESLEDYIKMLEKTLEEEF